MYQPWEERSALAIVRQVWRWGGWSISLALWFASSALPDKPQVVDAMVAAFVPAIAQGLLVFAVCLFVTWIASLCWGLCWGRITPCGRFGQMHERLEQWSAVFSGRVQANQYYPLLSYDAMKKIVDVCHQFDIGYPPLPERKVFINHNTPRAPALRDWQFFADDMARCASIKDLKQARNLCPKKVEQGP